MLSTNNPITVIMKNNPITNNVEVILVKIPQPIELPMPPKHWLKKYN